MPAKILSKAYRKAENELVNISEADMLASSSYLEDSIEVDREGTVLKDGQWMSADEGLEME